MDRGAWMKLPAAAYSAFAAASAAKAGSYGVFGEGESKRHMTTHKKRQPSSVKDMPVKDFLRYFSRADISDDDAKQGRQEQRRQRHEPQQPTQRRIGQ